MTRLNSYSFLLYYRNWLLASWESDLWGTWIPPPPPPPVFGMGLQNLQAPVGSRGPPPRRHHARAKKAAKSQRSLRDTQAADVDVARGRRTEAAQGRNPPQCYSLHWVAGKDTQQFQGGSSLQQQAGQTDRSAHNRRDTRPVWQRQLRQCQRKPELKLRPAQLHCCQHTFGAIILDWRVLQWEEESVLASKYIYIVVIYFTWKSCEMCIYRRHTV